LAALGWSGCLLFSESVNKAPVVTITPPSQPVVRDEKVLFSATVHDDKDSLAKIKLYWNEFKSSNEGCDWITPAAWLGVIDEYTTPWASDAPYPFTAKSLDVVCLCVRAVDHQGAAGQACQRIQPVNPIPTAVIKDVQGVASGQMRPLCSKIHLSAEDSRYPDGDQPSFDWSLTYTGADPVAGKAVKLASCDKAKPTQHMCFSADVTGTYEAKLTVTDTVLVNGAPSVSRSEPASFLIPVNVDMPPCLINTDPDMKIQRVILSRNPGSDSSLASRTFQVNSAPDDCDEYDFENGSVGGAKLLWSIYDSTEVTPTWRYLDNPTKEWTIRQSDFPNARPGDIIKLRVEVNDSRTEEHRITCSPDVTFCCGSGECRGASDECVRWTTWKVQFQP
jgi:hypothetical protein